MDKLSYAWGLAMGKQLQAMGVKEINSEEFKDGVKVAFDGGDPVRDGGALLRRVGELLETFGQGRVNVDAPVGAAPKTAFRIFVE